MNMPTFKDRLDILILLTTLLVLNTSVKRPIAPVMGAWNQQLFPRARFFEINLNHYYQAIASAQLYCMIFELISSVNAFCVSAIKDDHLWSMSCHFQCHCPLYFTGTRHGLLFPMSRSFVLGKKGVIKSSQ